MRSHIMHHRPDISRRRWVGHNTRWAVWFATRAGSEGWLVCHGYLGDLLFLKGQWRGCPVRWTLAKTVPWPHESQALCRLILGSKTIQYVLLHAGRAEGFLCGDALEDFRAAAGVRGLQNVSPCGASALIYHNLGSPCFVSQELWPEKRSKLFNGTQGLTSPSYNKTRGFFPSSGTKSMFYFK